MARSILLILALPYTLRFSLFEQYWALCFNTVQICAMARSILLILALPYTLRFSLFEQYWALCLSSSGRDDPTGQWNRHSRGQAQGLLIHPTPPLVPTGRLTSLAAFGRQNSLGAREVGWMLGGP